MKEEEEEEVDGNASCQKLVLSAPFFGGMEEA